MINEARIRMAHNKQRQRLKQLLATTANGGSAVSPRELQLACNLAKMDVANKEQLFSSYAPGGFVTADCVASRDVYGSPREVSWKGFHKALPYPELHGPGDFQGKLPYTKKQKAQLKEYASLQQELQQAANEGKKVEVKDEVKDEDVVYWHGQIKRLLETRFGEIRRAYRLIDQDNSGACDREELKHMLNAMFNLSVPDDVMEKLIDLADYDGDGVINFAEFARIVTAENVLDMKKTLTADTSGFGTKDPVQAAMELDRHKAAELRRKQAMGGYGAGDGYHPKLRKTGPSLDELRYGHKTLKKVIALRFANPGAAFDSIDADKSGLLRRAELRRYLGKMSKMLPDRIITGLIDYCDDDGDGKTLSKAEFVKLMKADYLGKGGFDPNVAHMRQAERGHTQM